MKRIIEIKISCCGDCHLGKAIDGLYKKIDKLKAKNEKLKAENVRLNRIAYPNF